MLSIFPNQSNNIVSIRLIILYNPISKQLASSGVAKQTGGRKDDRRSNIGISRREKASLFLLLGQLSIWASIPSNNIIGQTDA